MILYATLDHLNESREAKKVRLNFQLFQGAAVEIVQAAGSQVLEDDLESKLYSHAGYFQQGHNRFMSDPGVVSRLIHVFVFTELIIIVTKKSEENTW